MRTLASTVLAAALLAGCGGGDDSAPAPGTGPSGSTLVYVRSGGIAATDISLVIKSDGSAVLATRAGQNRTRTGFKLDSAENRALRRLADEADLAALSKQPPEPVACADCYSYRVRYHEAVVDRVETEVPEGLAELIAALQEVVDGHRDDLRILRSVQGD